MTASMNLHPAPAFAQASPCPRLSRAPLATHLCLPLALVLVFNAWLAAGGGDTWLADQLYHLEGGKWALKNAWLTSFLGHRVGKWLSMFAGLMVVLAAIRAWSTRHPWRWPLFALALSIALSTGLVSLLKHLTHMDCPWDLTRYGGTHPYFGLFQARHGIAASGCFPAGHASAGYAWIALYFFALAVRPPWRRAALAIGLCAGLAFGLSQQLRGAHFLSHDLWSLLICWTVPLLLFHLLPHGEAREVDA